MRAWRAVEVTRLPGKGGPVVVFDSVTKQRMAVGPATGTARLYACGITPYDATHLGHAFTYVSIDLLHRVWLDAGLEVGYAQNITDVDDPLLERAAATGVDWRELATAQIDLFRSDMEALRVLPPGSYRGVVESMGEVTALITELIRRGAVYQVAGEHPDWYFSVESDPAFLAGRDLAVDLPVFAERGGDPDRPGKRHKLDPLVWRAERPGEPSWDSPVNATGSATSEGRGRPGWHVECAAIALKALGADFDVQAGGSDLAFPHHPMCAAQAEQVTGQPFAKAYLHTGMVGLDGEKMSKSKGNLIFVHKLIAAGSDPMAIRLLLLDHHYRSDWEYSADALAAAAQRLERWRNAVVNAGSTAAVHGSPTAVQRAAQLVEDIRTALADDLDAPTALAAVDEWAEAANGDPKAAALAGRAVDALLGVHLG
ncbi:MAG: cysteine--1-D-myo-inosityl 2-amino-2-deoxy-alpha-D-glucopyranoside ligase [Propionibacteriaceae bacterium]|jgi:L-cysteine:1D-myo-inositol 2-amino-2-deoxy-alpha-D-glucopyranoside ligase|nr:cysteine--1-D-myo-inosityl 2-amino-2-deoxy-alpha-D-glucopyranoside ligase [Propionibacteriaceae bacterium]